MTVRILTDTERHVARLVAAGRSDSEVASELGLSAAVVAAHLSRVFRKLGAASREEVAALLPPTGASDA
jgi:DNA-binding CsgD family transcriptional regulator